MSAEAARTNAKSALIALVPMPCLRQFLAAVLTRNVEAHLVLLVAAKVGSAQRGSDPAGLTLF